MIRLSKTRVIRWTRRILESIGLKGYSLSLVLVDDAEIRRYHRRFLGQDRATDVLAFEPAGWEFVFGRRPPFLGDVIVSVETAKRVAPQFGNRWDEELFLYICHGILHLTGLKDSTPAKKAQMERRQEAILKKVLGRRWQSKKQKPLF